MLTHAGKLRLGVVGAVIGGPLVAMRVYVNPSVSLRSTAPRKGEPFYTAQLSCSTPSHTSASLASHRHKQANCLRFLCGARCDDKFCVTRRADVCSEIRSSNG